MKHNNNQDKTIEYYRLIAENTSDLISILDFNPKVEFLYVNSSYEKLLGYGTGELIGKSAMDMVHPSDQGRTIQLLKKYLKEKALKASSKKEVRLSEKIEYRVNGKSGKSYFLASTINVLENKLLFVSKDITEHKKIEEKLKQEKEKIQTYLDLVGVMIVALDRNQKVILINKTGCQVLGYMEDEIIGKNWFDNFVHKEQKRVTKEVRFSPLISDNDIGHKIKKAKKFIEGNDEVLFFMQLKGRQRAFFKEAELKMNEIVSLCTNGKEISRKKTGNNITVRLTKKGEKDE